MKALTVPYAIQLDLSGGLGVHIAVENNGEEDLINLDWSIELSGMILIQQNKEGTITSLPAGSDATINSGFVLGFGPGSIKVTVGDISKESELFLAGPFVFIR